jgi:hypothetical protein
MTEAPSISLAPDPVIARRPVGEIIDTVIGPWGLGTATFDETRVYRYRLSRVWDSSKPRVNFIMLNPSTADAFVLDPTVRRCVGFAMSWGAGALEVTNVFALRSTDPTNLRKVDDPVGVGNDEAIVVAAKAADIVVVGWGVHGVYQERARRVAELLKLAGVRPMALVVTKDGHPGHPLYVRGDAKRSVWKPRGK